MTFVERVIKMLGNDPDDLLDPIRSFTDDRIEFGDEKTLYNAILHLSELETQLKNKFPYEILAYTLEEGEVNFISFIIEGDRVDLTFDFSEIIESKWIHVFYEITVISENYETDNEITYVKEIKNIADGCIKYFKNSNKYRLHVATSDVRVNYPRSFKGVI